MDDVAHLVAQLTSRLAGALLPLIVACGAGSLLLRLLDDLRSAGATRARLPLAMTALFCAIALWTVPLLPLVARWPMHEGAALLVMTPASFCWSLAVAALAAEGPTVIRDSECVHISFPEFWRLLARLYAAHRGKTV